MNLNEIMKHAFADTITEGATESGTRTQEAVHFTEFTRRQRDATIAADVGRFSENRRARSIPGRCTTGTRSAQIGLRLDEHC